MPIRMVVVYNHFPSMPPKMRKAVSRRIQTAVQRVESDAKGRAPVDTGNLRNSIRHSMQGELTGVVNENAEYAAYVEFGTRYTPAQPHLGPAMASEEPRFTADCASIQADLG